MGIGEMAAVPVRVVDFDVVDVDVVDVDVVHVDVVGVVDVAADSMCNVVLFITMCIAVPVRVVDKGSQSKGDHSRSLFTGVRQESRREATSFSCSILHHHQHHHHHHHQCLV